MERSPAVRAAPGKGLGYADTYVFTPRVNNFSCATCTRFTRAIASSSPASSLACAAATRTSRHALHHPNTQTSGATRACVYTRSYDLAAYGVERRHATHLCGELGGARRGPQSPVGAARLRAEGAHATTPHATRPPRVRVVTTRPPVAAHLGRRKSIELQTGFG